MNLIASIPPHPSPSGCLGKLEPKIDMRTLQLSNYIKRTILPPPPDSRSWLLHPVQNYGQMLNSKLGDCVCAAKGHAIQVWTSDATGKMFTPPDQTILNMYEAVGHYVPGKPSTDTGCYMLDGLKYFRKHGIAGHTISGFVAVDPGNINLIKTAINLFGVIDVGLALPKSAQNQSVWDVPPGGPVGDGAPGSWGGHDVSVMAYDQDHVVCLTWAHPLVMTFAFIDEYSDEMYAMLSPDWFRKNTGVSVSGFKMTELQADLAQL
jgi:hypothetical protein